MEDERKRLLEVAKKAGLDVHHFSGIDKITEVLVENGVPFEPADVSVTDGMDPEDENYKLPEVLGASSVDDEFLDDKEAIAEMRDKLSEIELSSDDKEEVDRAREQVALATEILDNRVARRKAQAARKGERLKCVALKRFHVQKTDLGEADASGISIKVNVGQEMMLPAGIAQGLEARGQVRIHA